MLRFSEIVEIVKILIDNEELRLKVRRQQEEMEKEQKEAEERIEEKVEFETALLQQRIKQLMRDSEDEKQRHQMEKNALEEDRRDLESRLDMLRTEFDRLDDYWQVCWAFEYVPVVLWQRLTHSTSISQSWTKNEKSTIKNETRRMKSSERSRWKSKVNNCYCGVT